MTTSRVCGGVVDDCVHPPVGLIASFPSRPPFPASSVGSLLFVSPPAPVASIVCPSNK